MIRSTHGWKGLYDRHPGFAVSNLELSGLVRVVPYLKIFRTQTPLGQGLMYGMEWIPLDRGFGRYADLQWSYPEKGCGPRSADGPPSFTS